MVSQAPKVVELSFGFIPNFFYVTIILENTRNWSKPMKKFLIIVVVLAVIIAGGYAWFTYRNQQAQEELMASLQTTEADYGTLTATIGATGVVRSNQTAQLNWQTSGTVEQVGALVGDGVTTDQVLASLSETSLPQTVILAQADLVSAQKALDDLMNSQLQQAQALQAVENARKALEDLLNPELQQALALQAIADAQQAVDYYERQVNNLQTTANQSNIDAAQAQVTIAKDALDRAKEKFEPYAGKPETNLTRATLQAKLSEAQQQYDFAVRQLNALTGTAGETEVAVAQANLSTAQAQLAEAKREYERIKDGPSDADVALLEAQLEEAEREYERIKDGPDPDDIAVAEARIAAAEATVNQAFIKAPFNGAITMVDVKPGDQASPGTVAFRIDDLSHLLVDLQVSEVDINQIKEGQEVTMSFDAILASEYHGEVVDVALVGNNIAGVVNFTVTIELLDADEEVRPGMTSAVNIVIEQINEALLIPNRAVRVVDGERVVYTLKNGQLEPVQITIGSSSDLYSEVIDGELEPGDMVVLNPPSTMINFGGPPGRGGF
jgi:HlyD family secretion protein